MLTPRRALRHGSALRLSASAVALIVAACSTSSSSPPTTTPPAPALPLHCNADAAQNPTGSGAFGCWFTDDAGLAAYEFTMAATDPRAATFTKRDGDGGSTDQWHQIGNLRVKAMIHADGRVRLFDPTRGPKWVSDYSESELHIDGAPVAQNARRRIFGMGYGQYVVDQSGIRATRTVYAPFGTKNEIPAVIVDHAFVNSGTSPRTVTVRELWDGTIQPLNLELTAAIRPDAADADRASFMAQFDQTAAFDGARNAITVGTKLKASAGAKPPRTEAADGDFYPGTLALALLDGTPDAYGFTKRTACATAGCTPVTLATTGKNTTRQQPPPYGVEPANAGAATSTQSADAAAFAPEMTRTITVAPGATEHVRFVVAYTDGAALGPLLDDLRASPPTFEGTTAAWNATIPKLTLPSPTPFDAALAREIGWHGYHLLSSASFEEYYGVHVIDQGAAYGYLMGLRGAARDWLLNAVSVLPLRPDISREIIEEVLMTSTKDTARISYGTANYGELADANIHTKPSDLDLWLLFAITEYVEATRDFAFLNKSISYYPKTGGESATVAERIARSLDWLTVQVGIGDHGMIKVGTGDWSDGIAFLAPSADVLHEKGESAFNTAFATYVFPRVANLIEGTNAPLAAKYRTFATGFQTALEASYGANWYYRAWDGAGKPIGDTTLFLEHHAWVLIAQQAPEAHRASVLAAIDEKLAAGSKIGARVLFPYISTPIFQGGWDVNGGVWSAMNGLFVWGLSRTDPARAWKELSDNSMARHAETYPNLWYGIWSGPDSYVAPEVNRGGEAAYHLGTALVDFPTTNSNRHALPLLDIVKLAGLEYTPSGLVVKPRMPFATFALDTPLVAVKYEAAAAEGRTSFATAGSVEVTLPSGVTTATAKVNGAAVTTTPTAAGSVKFDVPAGTATWRVE